MIPLSALSIAWAPKSTNNMAIYFQVLAIMVLGLFAVYLDVPVALLDYDFSKNEIIFSTVPVTLFLLVKVLFGGYFITSLADSDTRFSFKNLVPLMITGIVSKELMLISACAVLILDMNKYRSIRIYLAAMIYYLIGLQYINYFQNEVVASIILTASLFFMLNLNRIAVYLSKKQLVSITLVSIMFILFTKKNISIEYLNVIVGLNFIIYILLRFLQKNKSIIVKDFFQASILISFIYVENLNEVTLLTLAFMIIHLGGTEGFEQKKITSTKMMSLFNNNWPTIFIVMCMKSILIYLIVDSIIGKNLFILTLMILTGWFYLKDNLVSTLAWLSENKHKNIIIDLVAVCWSIVILQGLRIYG